MAIKNFILGSLLLLVPFHTNAQQFKKAWGDIEYKGKPWVTNASKPNKIKHGLSNRHLSVWASHGRYFDNEKKVWKWQRPRLFETTEDLFTQTIVVPYLIPMLENAGAIVFTPRERDWQPLEVIVDNDHSTALSHYSEQNKSRLWTRSDKRGFAMHEGNYQNIENPFSAGTARQCITTSSHSNASSVSYQPQFSSEGRYAVYVSYQTNAASIDDAEYIVYHQGQKTTFHVNQQMGGNTWVYLGSFNFDRGCNEFNRVVLTNYSKHKGVVSADAVRFGGGMGNIERGGTTSGFPRCLEGARYYAQWAGAPYEVYGTKHDESDYGDDINVRPLMTNWLGGGSVFMPTIKGKKVPLELALAIHSDAGKTNNDYDLIGSLAVCTTEYNEGLLDAGISRQTSKDLARRLLDGLDRDLPPIASRWARRYLWDRNYSETRNPEVPSAILETLSHQNFADMKLGHDPNFKFALARSVYKTIARYINDQHGEKTVIQPLAPHKFKLEFIKKGTVRLSWIPTYDLLESTATAKSYNVYVATGNSDFDNGTNTRKDYYDIKLEPGIVYNFRVSAVNDGGESFPSNVLSAVYQPEATNTVLIVDAFNRLSSPAVVNKPGKKGFDLSVDEGVTRGITAGWEGQNMVAGNDFNHVRTHADAIASTHQYNVVSTSADAFVEDDQSMYYTAIDLVFGLQKNAPWQLKYYKTFTPTMQKKLNAYSRLHGKIMVSGSFLGSDMQNPTDKSFMQSLFKLEYAPTQTDSIGNMLNGLGMMFDYYRSINPTHYAATHPEVLQPLQNAICALQYDNGLSAAVAYKGSDYATFVMGVPFECIKEKGERDKLMQGILNYLIASPSR